MKTALATALEEIKKNLNDGEIEEERCSELIAICVCALDARGSHIEEISSHKGVGSGNAILEYEGNRYNLNITKIE